MDFKYIGFIYFSFQGYVKRLTFSFSVLPLILSLFILEKLNTEVNLKMTGKIDDLSIPVQIEKIAVMFFIFLTVFLTVCPLAKRVRDAGGDVGFWVKLYLILNILLPLSSSMTAFLFPILVAQGLLNPYFISFIIIGLEFVFFFSTLLVVFLFCFKKTNRKLVQQVDPDNLSPID